MAGGYSGELLCRRAKLGSARWRRAPAEKRCTFRATSCPWRSMAGRNTAVIAGESLLRRLKLVRLVLFRLSPGEWMAQRVYTEICRLGASA